MNLRRLAVSLVLLFSPAAFALNYPGDCDSAKLRRAASKNGCSVENGAKHHKVKKGGKVLTLIPNTVKPNGTCREVIKVIEKNC
ncbi:hypothetical protein P2318_10635 [Myxococcaceae bacterium GXIMD 01537]